MSRAGLEFIVERVVGVLLVPGPSVLHGDDDAAVAVEGLEDGDVLVRQAEVEYVHVLLDASRSHRLGDDDDATLGLMEYMKIMIRNKLMCTKKLLNFGKR